MSDKPVIITKTKEEWIDEFTATMAIETRKILATAHPNLAVKDARQVVIVKFIKEIIRLTMNDILNTPDASNGADAVGHCNKVTHDFKSTKFAIADGVATAFSQATSVFAKKDIEYFCEIHIVPEQVNKTSH